MRLDLVLFSYIFVLLGSSLTDPVGLQNASPTNLQRPNVHFLTHFILPGSLLTDLLFTNLRRDYVIPGSTTTTLSISRYLRWNYVSSGSGLEDFQSPMHLKRDSHRTYASPSNHSQVFQKGETMPLYSSSSRRNYGRPSSDPSNYILVPKLCLSCSRTGLCPFYLQSGPSFLQKTGTMPFYFQIFIPLLCKSNVNSFKTSLLQGAPFILMPTTYIGCSNLMLSSGSTYFKTPNNQNFMLKLCRCELNDERASASLRKL
ncbi:hypothetical protein C8J57DRAFT_131409 [Mycena rebaudengoi]|nr:hypothetical protein C8J57DRAFT_131409 [Mycena rebaudengoi]